MRTFLGIFIFLYTSVFQAQDTLYNDRETRTYQVANGTIINAKDVSEAPSEVNLSAIYFGAFGPEGFHNVGVCHLNMKHKFYIGGVAGPTGGIIDANIFFKGKNKPVKVTQSINIDRNLSIKEQIILPGTKRITSGVHFGVNSTYYGRSKFNPNSLMAYGAIAGYSFLIFKKAKWQIQRSDYDRTFLYRGSMFNRFNFDLIYYFKHEFRSTITHENFNPVGFRIYWDGCATTWSGTRAALSIHYMLGFGINANGYNDIPLLGGLGIGISF